MLSATADNPAQPYAGIPRALITPVFRMACRLRFKNPDVETLLNYVNTRLDNTVISALIEAALRLLPPESTPEGKAKAIERMQQKQEWALLHEVSFIDQVRGFGHQFLTESEQKQKQLCPTPDIRFHEPVLIQGHLCHWIEYKSYFGFKSNPFITSKDKKQFKRYASELGPGAVVYKLGYETEHMTATEINFFREAEVLHLLGKIVRV
ncbi:uncharacterized protein BO97DRAFT_374795 [Aspergillus homomorphus CBS 101889]|uniref:CDAN1-interacting nuclease 1 n=1 Tax=Aspergillus homomorphus (strain CBS 101889) TaxID=1450537 RepID=A0A395HT30_ASPHC|nr:hypothetical protein BO97DRAFT_374795 [Aspergillus homomorphus CBS 101889]RAL09374.1 hypothetical protein BO97DRAFT_374795 [Aspergillus homomorphus CBS 101889]